MARTMGKKALFDIRPAIESLGLEEVIEQVGLDRVIEQVGLDRVIEQVGLDRVIEQVGIDRWLASLSPAQRREVERRLLQGKK